MKKNNILLSHVLKQNTPSYGNRDNVIIRCNSALKNGQSSNTSTLIFTNNHIGTHIDVPRHFSDDGFCTYQIPINEYIFSSVSIIDSPCECAKIISISDIEKHIIEKSTELLLIRTGYEKYREEDKYWNDNPGLSHELAEYIRKRYPSIRCVGFDFISLSSWKYRNEGKKSHEEFLIPKQDKKPIMIIEDMSLKFINNKIESVIVAPIFIEDGNGGPVTVFANISKEYREK